MIEHDCKDITVDLKWMLSVAGLWPDKNPSKWLFFTKKAITFFFSFGIYASYVIEIYSNYENMAGNMYFMMSLTAYVVKLVLIEYNLGNLSSLSDDVGSEMFNFEFEPREQIVQKTIKITKFIGWSYRILAVVWFVGFIGYPIWVNQPLVIPLSYELGMYRIPMFVFQVIGLLVIGWTGISIDLLIPALMSITSTQIDILKKRLSSTLKSLHLEADNGDIDNDGIRRFLSHCVEHHLFIARFADKINKTFAIVILLQFLTAIITVCDGLFDIMSTEVFSSRFMVVMLFLLLLMQELSMYCWFGNEVIIKSLELLDSCYQSEWYKFDISNRKMLLLIMENVKTPIEIEAYKFSTASLPALMTIFKWSYSALAVLRNMYGKE